MPLLDIFRWQRFFDDQSGNTPTLVDEVFIAAINVEDAKEFAGEDWEDLTNDPIVVAMGLANLTDEGIIGNYEHCLS